MTLWDFLDRHPWEAFFLVCILSTCIPRIYYVRKGK